MFSVSPGGQGGGGGSEPGRGRGVSSRRAPQGPLSGRPRCEHRGLEEQRGAARRAGGLGGRAKCQPAGRGTLRDS